MPAYVTPMLNSLPIELWLEILSYHPRRFRRKMIGVNRVLFELALDDIYTEIRLSRDDEATLFVFRQLQHLNIAKRVHRLVIEPGFLPLEDSDSENQPVPVQTNIPHKLHSFLTSMKFKNNTYQLHPKEKPISEVILSTAQRNIMLCPNIRELTITIKGSKLTSSFKAFFKSLWHPNSISQKIRRLAIDCTPLMLANLLSLSLYRFSRFLTTLEDLNITFPIAHPTGSDAFAHNLLLSPFLANLQNGLVSFTTSGYLLPHLANLFKVAPKFAKLRKFAVSSAFNIEEVQQVEQLNNFLTRHSDTLEHLIIDHALRALSSNAFLHWIGLDIPVVAGQGQTFSQLVLPKLKILELGNRVRWIGTNLYEVGFIFPDLINIAPNLTSLAITDNQVYSSGIVYLLARLPKRNGICSLEILKMDVDILSPDVMDLLVGELHCLRSLELHINVSADAGRISAEQRAFCDQIRKRKYPPWSLKYLRITSLAQCAMPHPNIFVMEVVAESLSDDLILDAGYSCSCNLLSEPHTAPARERTFADFFE